MYFQTKFSFFSENSFKRLEFRIGLVSDNVSVSASQDDFESSRFAPFQKKRKKKKNSVLDTYHWKYQTLNSTLIYVFTTYIKCNNVKNLMLNKLG